MVRTLALLFAVTALSASLLAGERAPALVVNNNGKHEALQVSAVKAEARVFGFLAETRMTITFTNPNDRQFEGNLYFPLPEGSTVSGYALDINGKMVDGVVIEKDRGREIFEEIQRQGIDPGLVEWTKGNNFKTRVFPIPAKGSRTVMVRYVSELEARDGKSFYRLPLGFKDKVKDAALHIEVLQPDKEPCLSDCEYDGLKFVKWEQGFVADKKLHDAPLDKDVVVELPQGAHQVLVEKAPDGTLYFCLSSIPVDSRAEQMRKAPEPPGRITILWDASGSRAKGDRKRDIGFLKSYFAQPALAKEKVKVQLVLFRNAASAPADFTVKNGNADELLKALEKVDYDGGTQLGAIAPAAKSGKADCYFLFTDGIHTFGKDAVSGFKAPVCAFASDAGGNAPLLRHIAGSTGGQFFNLAVLKDDEVVPAIGNEPWSFISAQIDGRDVADLLPGSAEPVAGRFTMTGRLTADETVVTVNFGFGGRGMQREQFRVARSSAASGDLLARYWAQKKLGELLVSPKKNENEIITLGRKFSIVTPGTSLLVLESPDQYIRYHIRPPASQRDWCTAYDAVIEQQEKQAKAEEKSKLDHVLALWKTRVEWWEKEFKYPADFKYADTAKGKDQALGGALAPASPAAEAPRRALESRHGQDDMEVTAGRPRKLAKADGGPGEGERSVEATVTIKPWDPKTPYMQALKAAGGEGAWPVYMEQRAKFGTSPAFYLDCADFFFQQKQPEVGLQVLSNLGELELENAPLVRVMAHRLAQLGYNELAAMAFEEALRMRPEEPQSWRDLALVLAEMKQYERAMSLLSHVVMNRWARFDEIEVIALMELNNIIPKAKAAGLASLPIDERLVKLLDVDVRIILTWDADLTDIDMHVIEASGEEAFYGHNRTTIGGAVSRDFTQGYGPEEYILRKAMPGTYKVRTKFFGSRAQQLTGTVTLQLEIFTNYGRPTEKKQTVTVRLSEPKEMIDIGEIKL